MREPTWHSHPVLHFGAVYGRRLEPGDVVQEGDLVLIGDKGWVPVHYLVGYQVLSSGYYVCPVSPPLPVCQEHVDSLAFAIRYAEGLPLKNRNVLRDLLGVLAPKHSLVRLSEKP